MEHDDYILLIAIAIGLLAFIWFPVIWAYGFARIKGLEHRWRFALYCGSSAYGLFTLLASIVAIPIAIWFLKLAPTLCYPDSNSWYCSYPGSLQGWEDVSFLVLSTVFCLFMPPIFLKHVWSQRGSR
jgi:hypothetical protein